MAWDLLREKYPYSKLFWSLFSRIRTEYGEILPISSSSVRMRENTDQNNSGYVYLLRSDFLTKFWHSGQRFRRNNFTPLCLKFKTYKFPNLILVEISHWGCSLINVVFIWHHERDHMNFPGNDFWCAAIKLKFQTPRKLWNLNLNAMNLARRQRDENTYLHTKSHLNKLMKSKTNFIYHRVSLL